MLSLALMLGCFVGLGVTASAAPHTYATVYDAGKLIEYGETDGSSDLVLGDNITINETINVKKNVTIDLNGYTIDRGLGNSSGNSNGVVFKVEKGGTLTIKDSSGNNSGTITGGSSTNTAGGIQIEKGTVNLYGGKITGNKSKEGGGGIRLDGGDASTFNMYGGEICNNSADNNGGGINIHEGYVTIHGGKISGNTTSKDGGAIYVNDSHDNVTLNITGDNGTVEIEGNEAVGGEDSDGDGIFIADGKVNINNVKFVKNRSCGNAVYCDDDDGTTISNCVFEENCLYIDTDNVKLYNITANAWRTHIASTGNDFEIGGEMDCTIHLWAEADLPMLSSHIHLNEDLATYSAIDISQEGMGYDDVLVYCKGSALAANNYRYFHVLSSKIRAIAAENNQIRTAYRGSYVDPDTRNNEYPTRTYSVNVKTAGGWWDEGDNAVHINIIGTLDETGKIKLDGEYEPNSYNTFTFTAADVGVIERFEITYNAVNDWKVKYVEVDGKRSTLNATFDDKGTVISVKWGTDDIWLREGDISVGSVFGKGSVWVIVGIVAVLAVASVVTVIVVKKKKKTVDEEEDTEAEETENGDE